MPSQMCYNQYVLVPDIFQCMCGHSPAEFEDLHNDVLVVLEMTRDVYGVFTDAENQLRRKRRYKHSSRERFFHFLTYCRTYSRLRKGGADFGMSKSAMLADFVRLRAQLIAHPLMIAEVQWPTPDELEMQRLLLVRAGLLTAGF